MNNIRNMSWKEGPPLYSSTSKFHWSILRHPRSDGVGILSRLWAIGWEDFTEPSHRATGSFGWRFNFINFLRFQWRILVPFWCLMLNFVWNVLFIAATLRNFPSCYIMFFFTVWGRVMWGNKGWMGHVELRLSTKCQVMIIFRPPLATRSRDIKRIQILAATKHLVMLTVVSKYLQSASTFTLWHCCYLLFECCHFHAVFFSSLAKWKE